MHANLFDIAGLNVRGNIGRSTKDNVRKGRLNYVMKFYSSNPPRSIRDKVQAVPKH